MIESGGRLASILIGLVTLGGCRPAISGERRAPAVTAVARPTAPAPQHEAPPPSAVGYGFALLPDPDRLYGYDRVAVKQGGDIVQTLSLAQDRWVQSAEELRRLKFSLFDIDRDGHEDLVLWSEREADTYVTTWRFEATEGRFWPHPTIYYVHERTAPGKAAKPGADLSALLLTEAGEPDSDETPQRPETETPLAALILIHSHGRLVDFIENEEWVGFDSVAAGLADGSDGTPFVDANFDGHDDLRLSRSPCSGNCYFAFWLFDPKTRRFDKHEGLSSLASPELDAQKKEILSFHSHGLAGALHTHTRYHFVGRDIEKVWESEQADDLHAPGNLGGPFDGVFHRTVRALRQGTMQVLCEGFVNHETDKVLALLHGDPVACKY